MKRFLLIIVAIFIGIQFVRPGKNLSDQAPGPDHLMILHPPPTEVRAIFERACYDCHTNNTRYPWYAHVQPAAWWLNDHIKEGKKHFNFEEFGSYSTKRQLHKLEELIEELEEDKMPLPSYRLIHSEAHLTPGEVNSLITWTASVRKQIKQP